ncbi:ABC transporter substrate-binding protein, partial [Nitrospinota bacterium]
MRRKWMALLLVLVFGMVGPPVADAYKGKLTVALPGEPPTMDPNITSNTIGFMAWNWSYDTLVKSETGTGKIVPWLATKWKKLGPTKYKFWLRKGVKFTDGTPFTAAAVKYSMGRIQNPKLKSRQRAYFKPFKRIEIIDDHTFIYHQKWPDNGLFTRLHRQFLIISPKTKGIPKAKIARNTFGSGAYILKSWTRGTKMVFEANPNWWGNSRYPDRPKTLVLRRIVEQTTRVKALLRGEVDLIWRIAPQFFPQIKQHPDRKLYMVPSVRIFYLSFGTRFGGPFADRKVRLAANYAIDGEKIRRTILKGVGGSPYGQMYHPWSFSGYNPKKKWWGYDLAKAKKLMKESSYPNGFKATLITSHGLYPFDKATCEATSDMLGKIGIDTKCRAVNWPLYRKLFTAYQYKKEDPVMFFRGWGNSQGDSSNVVRGTSSCKGVWSVACFSELDALNEKAARTSDPKEQQALFESVTEKMKQLAIHKVYFKMVDSYAVRKDLKFVPRHDAML